MSSSTPISRETGSNPQPGRRGQLKVFLGYAAGVGKTYRMLEEAQRLKREGSDIVIGYFEPHGRKDTIAKTAGLEMIPPSGVRYRNSTFHEMDTDAILHRRPAICVVDELAHTNVPGSPRAKRWQDVQVLLDAGIDAMSNMNIQHLESLNDQVFRITGVRVRETVPDWFVKGAAEVVLVDATTGALLNRMKRGDIYAPEKAQRAMENFFKESTLTALRELALRQAAHEVELREVAEAPAPQQASPQATRDRILIFITADRSTAAVIRRGRRMADYLDADCFAVAVLRRGSPHADSTVDRHLNFAKNLHIETALLEGNDAADTVVDFAHRNRITQILLGRRDLSSWSLLLGSDVTLRIVEKAMDIRVILVAERKRSKNPDS